MIQLFRILLITLMSGLAAMVVSHSAIANQHKLKFTSCYIALGPDVAKVQAGYCRITNNSPAVISIVGAHSSAYGRVELHNSEIANGIASMRRIENLKIAPGETLVFTPEGLHFMLMQPKKKLQAGDHVTIEVRLGDGSLIPVKYKGKSMKEDTMAGHHAHNHMKKHAH